MSTEICKRAMNLAQAEVGNEYTADEIALGVHEYVSANDLMFSPSDIKNGWCDKIRRDTQEWRREQLKLARAAVREVESVAILEPATVFVYGELLAVMVDMSAPYARAAVKQAEFSPRQAGDTSQNLDMARFVSSGAKNITLYRLQRAIEAGEISTVNITRISAAAKREIECSNGGAISWLADQEVQEAYAAGTALVVVAE